MDRQKSGTVTNLLSRFRRGEPGADSRLIRRVYQELHKLAVRSTANERKGHWLQPTALVTDTYLRLAAQRAKLWKNRDHFFAVAWKVMDRIRVDHARWRRALKRGGGELHESLSDPAVEGSPALSTGPDFSEELMALNEALGALAADRPREAHVFRLYHLEGKSCAAIGKELGIAESTVRRDLQTALNWLRPRLVG